MWININKKSPEISELVGSYEHATKNKCLVLFDDFGHNRQAILPIKTVLNTHNEFSNIWGGMTIKSWQPLPDDETGK